jgi:hypothetical protein
MFDGGAATMAKKKTIDVGKSLESRARSSRAGLKTTPVKIETGLVRKAKTIAEDKGIDLSEYLSDAVRGAIERDWTKVLKKIVESEGGEN